MAIKEHFEGKRDLGLIDPRKLTTDPTYNVRDLDKPEAREGLDYLKALIKTTGVQTPLRIREDGDGNLIIVRGHRRHKVVMELIEEGHPIKLVPVTQEPRGTTPAERNWDLIDSNSEEPLTGLERAEALYRQIHMFGWDEKEILRRTGKTKQWLNTQLDLRAMPDSVKEQVNAGDVSATTALKVVKETRDAKTDPEFAAELIRKNKEENARIRGKRQRSTKVTTKTLKRDREKAKPQSSSKPEEGTQPDTGASPVMASGDGRKPLERPADFIPTPKTPVANELPPALAGNAAMGDPGGSLSSALAAPQNQILQQPRSYTFAVKGLIDALEPFAALAEFNDLNARSDDDLIEVKVSDVKRAWVAYTKATGGSAEDEAA